MRDALNIFGDAVAVLGANVDTDTLQFSYPNKGEGTVLWWVIRVTTDFAGGTSLQFVLMDSSDNFAADTRDAITSDDIVLADLVAGKEIIIGMRYDLKKDVKVQARPTGVFTAGDFDSYIAID